MSHLNQYNYEKENKAENSKEDFRILVWVGLIVSIIAGICTIFCSKDYSDDIKNAVTMIKKQTFVMEQIPDSLLEVPTVKQARKVQQEILVVKERIDHLDFAPRDYEDVPTAIYRYIKEMENFEILCNEIIKANDLISVFVSNNPQYDIMFNKGEYKKNTDKEKMLTDKIGEDMIASQGNDKSPEQKLKLLKKALNSKEMFEFLTLRKEILQQVFDYMNKVQREVKFND